MGFRILSVVTLHSALLRVASSEWAPTAQECAPTKKIPPGGRCLTSDQCEFGNCCPIFNYCNKKEIGWPDDSMKIHCGSKDGYTCVTGQPSTSGAKCKANQDGSAPMGLCSSFQSTISANAGTATKEKLITAFKPEKMDLNDARCKCTDDVKKLWSSGTFAGHWDASGNFVNACPSSGGGNSGALISSAASIGADLIAALGTIVSLLMML
eukprot:TRINITY_DN5009_c0_g1_i2.p1 TRINITY_DN5009_c0_g1~~TRINITY_DN5009_c0_g1_i2.p1  ORF type:complete len:231 (-),score=26.94 TRINITY_DN5009_c0_g1_i2:332-961(-)